MNIKSKIKQYKLKKELIEVIQIKYPPYKNTNIIRISYIEYVKQNIYEAEKIIMNFYTNKNGIFPKEAVIYADENKELCDRVRQAYQQGLL